MTKLTNLFAIMSGATIMNQTAGGPDISNVSPTARNRSNAATAARSLVRPSRADGTVIIVRSAFIRGTSTTGGRAIATVHVAR
jgi:hypothetical protein